MLSKKLNKSELELGFLPVFSHKCTSTCSFYKRVYSTINKYVRWKLLSETEFSWLLVKILIFFVKILMTDQQA